MSEMFIAELWFHNSAFLLPLLRGVPSAGSGNGLRKHESNP